MHHPAVLGQIVVGYCPVLDRERRVVATRLTVFPERNDAPPDAAALLQLLAERMPPAEGTKTGTAATALTRGLLNVAGEACLDSVIAALHAAPGSLAPALEVPAFMAGDAARGAAIRALHATGTALTIKGRPVGELPRELLPCFTSAIVDASEDRRKTAAAPAGVVRTIATIASGVRTSADVDAAFARGAQAVVGWPIEDDPSRPAKGGGAPDLHAVVELINRVDREEPAEKMEPVLKADPTLAFRLLRYINSAAFGLRVEVTSFRHALMLLGYNRLKRWLALLLASGSKDASLKPVMYAAVRRGMILEELARAGGDEEMKSEMFLAGVFSLLDRLMHQPFAELLKNLPVPQRVYESLASADGPYAAHLELVRAIEQAAVVDIREVSDRLLIDRAEVNRAVFAALSAARALD
jgi:EAL and modified HD-GYP domain-containing signal transduction protein